MYQNDNLTAVFRFNLKLEYVENRSVRRSLDFEDDTNNAISWSIRCVPIGHSAMFYLCRNSYPEYYEFIYDYSIVSGDGDLEQAYNRRAMVDPTQLCEEYLDPTIPIPVNPQKNWFILQIKIRHLAPNEFLNLNIPFEENANIEQIDSFNNLTIQPSPNKKIDDQVVEQSDQLLSLTMFSNRMLTMFSMKLNTDLTINCPPKTFMAHKAVLSASSIVFRTMFEHAFTKESITSELLIEEFDYRAVLIMLQWFYCSEVCVPYPEIRQLYLSDEVHSCDDTPGTSKTISECICFDLTDDLLLQCTELAHKYDLHEMEFQCENKWTQRLTVENICSCLYYAEMFQLYGLKMSCTEIIRKNPKIMEDVAWKRLIEWQPEIEERVSAALNPLSSRNDVE